MNPTTALQSVSLMSMFRLLKHPLQNEHDASIRPWLASPMGRQLSIWEQRQLATVMPRVLGYRLLQIGEAGLDLKSVGGSAILHHWVLGTQSLEPDTEKKPQVVVDAQNLPIASQSVDAVLLPHSLELCPRPHTLLREVDRVLCSRGQVVILGFNPLSLWRLGRLVPFARQFSFPAGAHPYGCGRVCDWLGVLDFEVETLSRFGAVLPWTGDVSQYQDPRRWLAPFSQAYMIFARKRVVPLTPQRRRWPAMSELGPAVLPEARVVHMTKKHKTLT